ncbi:MAG: SMP-30/gluconolactonase/LRE family protein [Dehalococcoidia bacterium]
MSDSDFEVRSEAFNAILRPDSRVEKVADGFQFLEGPVWFAEEECLLFSDIFAAQIKRWSPRGGVSTFRAESGRSNGNYRDLQGRLVTAGHRGRNVTRTEPDGSLTVLADRYQGKRLNSPNDIVVKSDGALWFTDPPYGVKPEERELPAAYVFRLDPQAGELTPVADGFAMPNGLCFSPDETLLYIADSSDRHHVRVFDVVDGQRLANGRLFAVIEPGIPDGMRVDTDGRLYSTAGDGIQVFSAQGELLGKILVEKSPANCCFGGEGKHTLYITAQDALYRVTLASAGAQAP